MQLLAAIDAPARKVACKKESGTIERCRPRDLIGAGSPARNVGMCCLQGFCSHYCAEARSARRFTAPFKYTCFISFCARSVFQNIRMRMHMGCAPGRSISTALSNGTCFQPSCSLAATAGNSATRSGLVVNWTAARSSDSIPFCVIIVRSNSPVADITDSLSFASAVVAPRTPRTFMLFRSLDCSTPVRYCSTKRYFATTFRRAPGSRDFTYSPARSAAPSGAPSAMALMSALPIAAPSA